MVGKPNLPETGDLRPELQGAARPTAGLTALDQEREASMADEGGASGAVVEGEEPSVLEELLGAAGTGKAGVGRSLLKAAAIGVAVGLAISILTYRLRA